MKISDYRDELEKIVPGEMFLVRRGNNIIAAFGRVFKTGHLCLYNNMYNIDDIDSPYAERVLDTEIGEDVTATVCRHDMFIAMEREHIRKHIRHCIENPDEEESKNLVDIRTQLNEMGGRCIRGISGDDLYMIGATATDEDYYYVYIGPDYRITASSCVGTPGEILGDVPEELRKFTVPDTEVSDRVRDAIILHMTGSPEMFFTPVYYDFADKYTAKRFIALSFCIE